MLDASVRGTKTANGIKKFGGVANSLSHDPTGRMVRCYDRSRIFEKSGKLSVLVRAAGYKGFAVRADVENTRRRLRTPSTSFFFSAFENRFLDLISCVLLEWIQVPIRRKISAGAARRRSDLMLYWRPCNGYTAVFNFVN